MKKLNILILLGFLIILDCNSQDYIPILGDSNVWYIITQGEGYGTEIIHTVDDTIIDDKQYIITDGTGYLYEDTIEKKVYKRDPWWGKEILLYDFSILEGDSIQLQYLDIGGIVKNYDKYIVDSIGLFQLVGIESRAIYLSGKSGPSDYYEHPIWIEGMGSLGNLQYSAYEPDIWNLGELACYYKNGELLYQSSLSKELGRCDINTSFIDSKSLQTINIHPNPFTDQFTIEGLPIGKISIEIYDIFGRKIYQDITHFVNSHIINTSGINPGIYLIRIRNTNNGDTLTSKIIIKR